jgi:sRNA-binding carbon storage regulator CsrA
MIIETNTNREILEGSAVTSSRGERGIVRTPIHSDGLIYVTWESGKRGGYFLEVFGLTEVPDDFKATQAFKMCNLSLTTEVGKSIKIGDAEISFNRITEGGKIVVSITAPRHVNILRSDAGKRVAKVKLTGGNMTTGF